MERVQRRREEDLGGALSNKSSEGDGGYKELGRG